MAISREKNSIRLKITLWFSLILLFISFFTLASVFYISRTVMQKTVKDALIRMVENNYDEVEYYEEISQGELDRNDDQYLQYQNGYIEIDDDFITKMNGISAGVYYSDGKLFVGSDPNPDLLEKVPFSDGQVQTSREDGINWYIYDRSLAGQKLDGLWLRGAVSEQQGQAQMSSTMKMSMILLPVLVIFAIVGGYIFAGRLLRPINEINETAMEIGQGRDLSKRIDLGPGNDELHQLAGNFNDMMDRLEKSFDAEKQFSSDVSHELRTPISVIRAECEYILEQDRDKEEYIEALETIERQEHHMSRMVEDLLMFSRLERGTDIYPMEDMDLSGLVESVCVDMALLQVKGIRLDWSCQEQIHIKGSRSLIIRMLTNLISNAYRYGRDHGWIHVRLYRDKDRGDQTVLQVEDNGIGIAPEENEKIFHRFYQVDSSRTGSGTGLGLSMVQEICRYHGADISLSSQPGEGSSFYIIFFQ